jgi:protein-S-isoprenylcysteine O-methyltransferase Ste14
MLLFRLPPPLIFLLSAGAMSLIADLWPGASLPLPLHLSWGAAAICGILSLTISYLSTRSFRRAKTTVDPRHPEHTSTLVTHGVYRFSRNPMYLALLLLLLGWALILANAMALLGLPLCFFYLDFCQIRREEQHLQQRFAAEYRAYQSRVRRWL